MKFRVTIKDPDVFDDALCEAVRSDVAKIEGIDDDERKAVEETRVATYRIALKRWVEHGEYIRVDFDLDAMTAIVVDRKGGA